MNVEEPSRPRPVQGPAQAGSAMVRRFGWFYRVLGLGRALASVRFEAHSVERIREAAARGPIVYVLLERSTLDHLALNTVLNRRALPLSLWSNGGSSFQWQTVWEAWAGLFSRWGRRLRSWRRPDPVRSGWLTDLVADGGTVTVFLEHGDEGPAPEDDPLRAILEAQDRIRSSVQLVPVICVWDRAPEQYESAVRDFLLGSRETPSLLTKLRGAYLPGEPKPFLQVGEPLDLGRFVARAAPDRRLDSLRTLLRRYLKRESRVVRGPRLLARRVLRSLVLDAPPMRRFAEEEAAARGVEVLEVQRRMAREFDAVAANFSWTVIRFLSVAMRPLWNRVYSGYHIRPDDLDRIRVAMRQGTAVLVPCHKSHFDYLLLSWVLFWHDLIVPHIVAGINLAIWPVHYLLRGAGAFFIRRSFKDDRIHPRVFGRYLRELLLHGYTVEFFIEGGRTRSGKLMPPKLGVLDMILEAAETAPIGHEITLLPVAIAYEQVAEEHSYQEEMGGKAKTEETVGQLLRARSVLRRRFGRVFLRVGEPVRASEVVRGGWRTLDPDDHRDRLRHTGELLVHRIGQAMVVLPTNLCAMSLVAHHRRGIRHEDLLARLRRFHALMERSGAEMSDALLRFDAAVAGALDRFLREGRVRRLGDPSNRVWEIVPEQRVLLDFHKNQVLHHVAIPALTTAVIRGLTAAPFGEDHVRDDLLWLLGVLRREFVLDPDASPSEHIGEALDALEAHGALVRADTGWTVADPERMGEIHGLVRALLESYLLVLESAARLTSEPTDAKALVADVVAGREAALASGHATRPETFSAVALKTAVSDWQDEGVFVRAGDKLTVDTAALEAALSRLAPMVR